jgi:hypothetical protein
VVHQSYDQGGAVDLCRGARGVCNDQDDDSEVLAIKL